MRIRKSHLVIGSIVLSVSLFVVECVPYPNIGLPFGYWTYPNRALRAFLECRNVHDVRIDFVNHDIDLEEFTILVEYEEERGRRARKVVSFPQYPSQSQIDERVVMIGCR